MSEKEALKRIQVAEEFKLTTLDLSNLGLTRLPLDINRLRHLKILDLGNNHIRQILQGIINNNTYLRSLILNDNDIVETPTDIFQLVFLKTLVLRNNSLKKIFTEDLSVIRSAIS